MGCNQFIILHLDADQELLILKEDEILGITSGAAEAANK